MNEAELRDYFAGLAMKELIAKSKGHGGAPLIAKYAYEYADEMLEAREPKHEQKAFY